MDRRNQIGGKVTTAYDRTEKTWFITFKNAQPLHGGSLFGAEDEEKQKVIERARKLVPSTKDAEVESCVFKCLPLGSLGLKDMKRAR